MNQEIKTKELEANIIFNKHSFKALGSISPSKHFCIPAMMEFAQQVSIEFAQWTDRNGYTQQGDGRWESLSDFSGKTSIQLYELFSKQTESK